MGLKPRMKIGRMVYELELSYLINPSEHLSRRSRHIKLGSDPEEPSNAVVITPFEKEGNNQTQWIRRDDECRGDFTIRLVKSI